MIVSNLLTLTHYTYTETFLKRAGILGICANVTFDEYNKIL